MNPTSQKLYTRTIRTQPHQGERLAIFLATSGHSGVDRIMTNLIHAFAEQGLQVDLLHVRNHGPHLDPVPANVRVVDLGAAHVNSSLFPLLRYLRRERPAALLSDKDKVNRLAIWSRRLAGVTTRVVIRTGTTVSKDLASHPPMKRWIQRFSMRRFYPGADGIIVPSQGAATDLAAVAALPLERIQVIPNPILTPALERLAAEPIEHPWFVTREVPVILGVGELCARKDFATLIRAFSLVRQKRSAKLVILGRGRQQEALRSLADKLGVADDLSLPGFVSNPYAYMKRAGIFVQTSRYEGFGNVLAEALAVGIPVVSTDCPSGPREILQGGRYGALVPVGDAQALSDAILHTLDNPPDPSFLKQGAAPFEVHNSARRYLEVLGLSR